MYETLPNYANNSQVSCHLEKKLLKLLQLQNCHSTSVVHKSLPTNSSVCGFVCRGPLYLLNCENSPSPVSSDQHQDNSWTPEPGLTKGIK
uniref:Uncharacterized protein n=1 Tax=Timema genevievae TaxID=629358 RepID=A0A7R9PJF6_TIMGE|nr:unnamed protein product [Timema genevievae]